MPTTLEWFGCATFRLQTSGLRIMLDAYLDRAAHAEPTGTGVDDIDMCDWVLIGHSHFDHLYGAERIMANTEATLVGSYETVRVMVDAGVPEERMIAVSGGETIELSEGVSVEVFPSLHSCVWSHAEMSQPDEVCLGDLGVPWHEQRERMEELTAHLSTNLAPEGIHHLLASLSGHSHRGDGGALIYRITTPDGSIVYQDTSGVWTGIVGDMTADVAILAAAGRANIDGQPVQGSLLDFLRAEVDAIEPSATVLCHHDNWLPGFSVATDMDLIRGLFEALPTDLLELGYSAPRTILPR